MAQDRDNLGNAGAAGSGGDADPRLEVEAKLLAYVEGELDSDGRAEIEKHLTANPQHRRLMKELAEVREAVRSLPRERAPVDMTEVLTGQLERSVLFGESADDGEATLHINRWPQFLAVAAVVLLAVGLAAVIYFVLPPTGPHVGTVAMRTPAAGGTGSDGMAVTDAASGPSRTELAEKPAAEDPATGRRHEMKEGETALAMNEARKGGTGEDRNGKAGQEALFETNLQVQRGRFALGTVNAANNATTNAAGNTVYLVVCTDNPAATNTELTRYLTTNGIVWTQGTEPMPQGPAGGAAIQQQAVMGSRLNTVTVRMKEQQKDGQDVAVTREQEKIEGAKQAPQERQQVEAVEPAKEMGGRQTSEPSGRKLKAADQSAVVVEKDEDRQNRLMDEANRDRRAETASADKPLPATRPAADVERQVVRGAGQGYYAAKQPQRPDPSQATIPPEHSQQPTALTGNLSLNADAKVSGAIDGYIVARGLTRVQATALYDNISKQPAAQKVEIVEDLERGADVAANAPASAAGPGQASQEVLMQQQANAGPAEQHGRQAGQAPATHPAEAGQRGYGEYASKQAGGGESNWKMQSRGSTEVNSAAAPAAPPAPVPPAAAAVTSPNQQPAAPTEKKLDELEKSSEAQAAPALTLQPTTRPQAGQVFEPVPATTAPEGGDRLDVVIVFKNQPVAAAQMPATQEAAFQPTAARAATPAGPVTRPAASAEPTGVPAK